MPPTTSRRTLLRLTGLGLAAVAVSGCTGERRRTLWSPTPDAGEPTGPPPPDLELLLAARDRIVGYRALLSSAEPAGESQRSALRLARESWPIQQERLEAVIRSSGADLPDPPADGAAATTSAGAATTAEPLPMLEVGRAVREDLPTALAQVASSTPTNRAMLTSLAAEHAVSAGRSGAGISWPMLVGPTGTAAVPVLAAARPAVFALEVAAARSLGEERELYESILDPLQAITRALTTLADGAAPVPPLGYDLPQELETSSQRGRLAQDAVRDIAPAVLSVVDRAGSSVAQVESCVRIIAESTLWARRLGAEDVPFPGMTLP